MSRTCNMTSKNLYQSKTIYSGRSFRLENSHAMPSTPLRDDCNDFIEKSWVVPELEVPVETGLDIELNVLLGRCNGNGWIRVKYLETLKWPGSSKESTSRVLGGGQQVQQV